MEGFSQGLSGMEVRIPSPSLQEIRQRVEALEEGTFSLEIDP